MSTSQTRSPKTEENKGTRFAMIHFLGTRLHEHVELKRGAVWFLEKEPSHWTIHFHKTHLHGMRSFKNAESLPTKLLALFLQCSLPHRSHAFILCSDTTSVIVHRVRAPTLFLPPLCHDGSDPDGVGHGHRW